MSLFVDLSLGVVLVPFSNEKRAGKGNAYEALGKKVNYIFGENSTIYDRWFIFLPFIPRLLIADK